VPQLGFLCAVLGALSAWVGLGLALARPKAPKAIRWCQVLTAVLCGLCFLTLMVLVARADTRVRYAVEHAAPAAAGLGYRLAAVWAGQAGGLLLWGFETALVALFFRPAAMPRAAGILSAIEGCLLGLVALKNPFGLPEPGASGGMNPMLLHPMMLIHPPMLFLGYALLAAPYAITVGALIDRRPESWPQQVRPWILLAWLALTLGNGFGGEWAYKTFGWGGFWAWDPVENTSFVPWMLAAASVHSLWLARRHHRWLRAAAISTVASFLTVLYGSYLARSGALAGASVHAYVAGERLMQYALLTLLIGATALAGALLIARWSSWQVSVARESRPATGGILSDAGAGQAWQADLRGLAGSRLTAICIAAMFLIAGLVLVGMSLPMAGLSPTATLYNTVLMPVAALMVVLMVCTSVPKAAPTWSNTLGAFGAIVTLAAVAMAVKYGATIERSGLVVVQAIFAPALLVSSAAAISWSLWQFFGGPSPIRERAAPLAHFGVAALLAGAVLSGYGTDSRKVYLVVGEEQRVLGHFVSALSVSRPSPRVLRAEIYADGRIGVAEIERSELFDVELRRAYIRRGLFSDLYITPHGILAEATEIGGQKVPPGAMVEVAVKPGMCLVWLGIFCIAAGAALALCRSVWKRGPAAHSAVSRP